LLPVPLLPLLLPPLLPLLPKPLFEFDPPQPGANPMPMMDREPRSETAIDRRDMEKPSAPCTS
jgi:hypothetical protein